MDTPEWLKPGIFGAAVGAIALAIVGFSVGRMGDRRHG
jgi:hypothetical protein